MELGGAVEQWNIYIHANKLIFWFKHKYVFLQHNSNYFFLLLFHNPYIHPSHSLTPHTINFQPQTEFLNCWMQYTYLLLVLLWRLVIRIKFYVLVLRSCWESIHRVQGEGILGIVRKSIWYGTASWYNCFIHTWISF